MNTLLDLIRKIQGNLPKQEKLRVQIVRVREKSGATSNGIHDKGIVELIEGDLLGHWRPSGRRLELSSLTLLAPIVPYNLFAIGRNYLDHAQESNADLPAAPLLFIKANSALSDPGAPIRLPKLAPTHVDFAQETKISHVWDRRPRRS